MELVGYEDDEARSYEVFSFVMVHIGAVVTYCLIDSVINRFQQR